jgi:hypothetical protein
MQLEFIVIGQQLLRSDSYKPAENSEEYLKVHFSLPEDYKGLRLVHFKVVQNGEPVGNSYTMDDTLTYNVPGEYIKYPGFYVGISSADNNLIPSTWSFVEVTESCIGATVLPSPSGNKTQYEEIIQMYQEVGQMLQQTSQKSQEVIEIQQAINNIINPIDTVTGLKYKQVIIDGKIYLEVVQQ